MTCKHTENTDQVNPDECIYCALDYLFKAFEKLKKLVEEKHERENNRTVSGKHSQSRKNN